jgi:DNA-binding transcriptional LysR family regulator
VEFRQIRYAIAVAREGSFTKAAERLNISQSAVSEQVKLLEERLGFDLLNRTGRGVEMTERGRVFLYEAERVAGDFMNLADVARHLREAAAEKVNIGIISGLAPILVPKLFPAGLVPDNVQLEIRTAPTRAIFDALHKGRLDFGFAIAVDPDLVPSGLSVRRLFEVDLVLITRPGQLPDQLPGGSRGPVDPRRLMEEPIIMSELSVGYGVAVMDMLSDLGVRPRIRAVVDNIETMKVMVQSGIGHAFVPAGAADTEVALGLLEVVPLAPPRRLTIETYRPRMGLSKQKEALYAGFVAGWDAAPEG